MLKTCAVVFGTMSLWGQLQGQTAPRSQLLDPCELWLPNWVLHLPDWRSEAIQPTGTKHRKRLPIPGATVEVVGSMPTDPYALDTLPRVKMELMQAFFVGSLFDESSQILTQFMNAEPGRFIAQPGAFWYNGTAPEELRWEGMWGVRGGYHGVTVNGFTKVQTLANRGMR